MSLEGPPLEALTRRLAECPADFLAEPRIGRSGVVNVAAVAADLFQAWDKPLDADGLAVFLASNASERNRLRLILLACWLLHDDGFASRRPAPAALEFLASGLNGLAGLAPVERFIQDPDRREELARLCLSAVGLRPAGETEAQAQDRLATLNSAERQRVVAAARAAEARAQAIRRKLAEEAARRAESKAMPE